MGRENKFSAEMLLLSWFALPDTLAAASRDEEGYKAEMIIEKENFGNFGEGGGERSGKVITVNSEILV